MKITKKLCSKIINFFKDFIILMNMFSRKKKEIQKKEEIAKDNKDSKAYEYVYDYLENEVVNKNDEEDISNEARRFIKKIELEKERRFRRGSI